MNATYTWLLFDADGTLFDYDQAEAAALEQTMLQFGLRRDPQSRELYKRVNATLWRELELGAITPQVLRVKRFELFLAETGQQASAQALSDAYLIQLAQGTHLIDGAAEVVRSLAQRYRLAIISNGLKDVLRPRLAASAIGEFFPEVIISEEAGAAKPDAAIFDAAFRKMGNPRKEQVLLIGDGLSSDILGGNRYGIDTCWFNPAHKPRDPGIVGTYEIARLGELEGLLK